MRTRSVDRPKYRVYFRKSEEFMATANDSLANSRYNACMLNAVHAAISAADARLVFVKGFRHAGMKHDEDVELFSTIFKGEPDHKKNVSRFSSILSVKNGAEYLEVLLGNKDAANIVRDASRFLEYVRSKLPKQT
ncbi:MAG: HEPN domain-containing protein [Methanobacteriota archaeon]